MTELHVITTVFNPAQYRSRYKLYWDFRKHILASGGSLMTIELAFEDQPFVVTEREDPLHIQLRSNHQIWYKENLVNIAIRKLPAGWTHTAWLDADISFDRPDWLARTSAALQKDAFVQMFSTIVDLGPRGEPLKQHEGFAYKHRSDPSARRRKTFGQPGYAWAARRDAFEAVGGLIDWSILGSNDYYMGRAMLNAVDPMDTRMPGSNYANAFLEWQERFQRGVGDSVGYVDVQIRHHWHGRRADRGYGRRWRILVANNFDPKTDLRYRDDGLLELTDDKPALRNQIRTYFEGRNEDEIDV